MIYYAVREMMKRCGLVNESATEMLLEHRRKADTQARRYDPTKIAYYL